MAAKAQVRVLPKACTYHGKKESNIKLELASVTKKDIEFQMTPTSFCMKAPRNNVKYFHCWIRAHEVNPEKAKGTFKNGLLIVAVPLAKSMNGVKIPKKWPSIIRS